MGLIRSSRPVWAIVLALSVMACEPQNTVVAPSATAVPSSAPSTSATAPGGSGASSGAPSASGGGAHVAGSPEVQTSGGAVVVTGLGSIQATPTFDLKGNVAVKLSTCSSNGTHPFIWVYTEFNAQVGVFVEEVNHIKNATGKYYMKVVSNPDCGWTITLSPE